MPYKNTSQSRKSRFATSKKRAHCTQKQQHRRHKRPAVAYRHRGIGGVEVAESFNAPEVWHEPQGGGEIEFVVDQPGSGYIHPVSVEEVRHRIAQLPTKFTQNLEFMHFSKMTRKRCLFPCYGMQWGPTVYLYPIEESLVEMYVRPPTPQQLIEVKMYGGRWSQQGELWSLEWSETAIKDFYLNNVLIHEIGHINDCRNKNFNARERYANWFAVEYGYRASRGRC